MKRLLQSDGAGTQHTLTGGILTFTAVSNATPIRIVVFSSNAITEPFIPSRGSVPGMITLSLVLVLNEAMTGAEFKTLWDAGGDNTVDYATVAVSDESANVSTISMTTLTGGSIAGLSVTSDKLVAAVASTGSVKLHFDVASSEPSNTGIENIISLTCAAGDEKAVLEELYVNINNRELNVIEMLDFDSVLTTTAIYDVIPT